MGRVAHASMALLGVLVGLVARLWLSTLRVTVHVDPSLSTDDVRPWVMGFWHGTQFALFGWKRRRPTAVMVSHSRDGSLQARALAIQGLVVIRGSSSRGGALALARMVRSVRRGMDAAFAVDGPRGPCGVVKGGVVTAARAAGARLVPVGAASSGDLVLDRAWDRFAVARPFARVAIVFGAPVDPATPDARTELDAAIRRANADARRALQGLGERALTSG